jgi:cytochrome c oxidase subunit 2
MMKARIRSGAALAILTLFTGCKGWQSALHPQAPQAHEISRLILTFTIVSAVVWVLVMLVLLIGLIRRKAERAGPLDVDVPRERRAGRTIFACAAATMLIVLALSVLSYLAQRTVFATTPSAVTVLVTGHQWWWQVEYEDESPHRTFTTANEIRVPVGEPVTVKLETRDDIHSFWVPSLTGKMDLIAGQQNQIQFTALKPGVYRGQCAEFCGLQHAHMAFQVIALPPEQFSAWRDAQIRSAYAPDDPQSEAGERLFRAKGCALCHTIRGTLAGGRLGPDLTHFASRQTIAAGTLPLNPGALAAWISDPQHIKPGNFMPTVHLQPDELIALVHYLRSLR